MTIKEYIKKVAKRQPILRQTAKTSHEKYSPDAYMSRMDARLHLRAMYIVYGTMKGRTIEQIEPTRKSEPSQYLIDKYTKLFDEMWLVTKQKKEQGIES